jgi:hypothetical protein
MQVLSVDTHPVTIDSRYVVPVGMFEIPATLRQHAHEVLGDMSGGEWWTIGEFLADGETLADTAVARRRRDAGEMVIVFGVEGE